MSDVGNALDIVRAGTLPGGLDGSIDDLFFDGDQHEVYQQLRMRLDIFTESVVMTQYEAGRATQCYEVDPSDVAAALSDQVLATGLLPENCLFYAKAAGAPRIAVYLPPQTRTLTVVVPEHAEITTPLPGLVFVGHRQRYEVYAVKSGRPQAKARLFKAPFPNVYGGGSICWGSVDVPNCTAGTIHEVAETFLTSHFNADLNNGKSDEYPANVTEMWRALQVDGADIYPTDDLVYEKDFLQLEDLWKA
jgi:PRTRC genetic system protein B